MAKAATKVEPPKSFEATMREMARTALDRSGNLEQKAAAALYQAVTKDPAVYAALAEPLVRNACYEWVRRSNASDRRAIRLTVVQSADAARAGIANAARATRAWMCMDYPLPGGLLLGDAGRADLARTIEYRESQSSAMMADAQWFRLIMQSVPDGKRVRDVLTEERLAALRSEMNIAS